MDNMNETNTPEELQLPGFRFHPTEEELLEFYLKSVVYGKKICLDIIGFLNIYHHDPWDLPGLSKIGEREWYFLVPRDRKHGSGGRPNRTTEKGFWKATGSDRKIVTLSDPKRVIGLKKTLVFYQGRAPRGTKTDWVMNEYRLPDSRPLPKDIVLCKIYRKATSMKVLEQRAAMEEEMMMMTTTTTNPASSSTSIETLSFCSQQEEELVTEPVSCIPNLVFKKEREEVTMGDKGVDFNEISNEESGGCLRIPFEKERLPELQVPKLSMEWGQDPFWNLSPWLQNLTPYANILNF